MGKFYDLIQQHIDEQPYEVPEAQIAKRLGVTQTTLSNWKTPKRFISKKHVIAVSKLTGVRYEKARDALLEDIGWDAEDSPEPASESRRKAGESA